MKYALIFVVGSLMAVSAAPSFAGSKDLRGICSSARLTKAERADCNTQFKAAATDADRLAVFKAFDSKMNGDKEATVQSANAPAK
jgi:hypothetical protein